MKYTTDDLKALDVIAGVKPYTFKGPSARTCGAGWGRCTSKEHVHPTPGTQQDRVEYMKEQGYTDRQIEEVVGHAIP